MNELDEGWEVILTVKRKRLEQQIKELERQVKIESDGWKYVSKLIDKERIEHLEQIKELKSLLNRYREMDKSQIKQIKVTENLLEQALTRLPYTNCGELRLEIKQALK